MSWGEHGFADAGDVRLHYVRAGAGASLLLLHGWPQTWREWDAVAPALARDFDVIAVDLPGLGESGPLAGGYGKRAVADCLTAMLDALGLHAVSVAGHDMGAAVRFALAAFHPERVADLVALDMLLPGFGLEGMLDLSGGAGLWHFAFHQPPGVAEMLVTGRERQYLGWFFDNQAHVKGAISPAAVEAYVEAYSTPATLAAGFGYYRSVLADAAENALFSHSKIRQPVLCVAGESGTGAWMEQSFSQACAAVSARIIPDCGHWLPEEQPREIAALTADFLRARDR